MKKTIVLIVMVIAGYALAQKNIGKAYSIREETVGITNYVGIARTTENTPDGGVPTSDAKWRIIRTITAPEYKQRNMTARAVEIADDKAQKTATKTDVAESDAIRIVWAKIKAVRAKSNELEAQYIAEGKDLTEEDIESIRVELETAGQ
jgi:hypothetical protein